MATKAILAELARRYEAESAVQVAIRAMGGVDAAKLVRAGETLDIVVLAGGVMAQLEVEGRVLAGSTRGFARSGMAVAAPAGAPPIDVGDEAAVRRAVAAARAVGYSTGPSGDHLLTLYQRWGLPQDGLVKAPPGVPVAALLARGEADLGFQQLSELIAAPGIRVLGTLPAAIQSITLFSAGVCSTSPHPVRAAALIDYLVSEATDPVKRGQGMEPARDQA